MAADSVFRISRPLTVDVVITSTWNALISTSVLVLRFWKLQELTNDSGDVPTQPNFFDFHTCSIIFLVNLLYCGAFCKLRLVTREWLILTKFGWCLPVFFHCASVLLGAPVLKDSVKTMSFALLITGLVLPSVVTTKAADIVRFSSLEWVQLLPVSTLTGAWLGAAVIPLDWDRPWQVWPEPSCIGAAAATAMHSLYDIIRISISWVGRSPRMRKQRQT